jgi:hypothetical protein
MNPADVIDLMRDAVIVLDPVGKVTSWAGSAERMFGFTEEEALGRSVDELLGVRDANDRAQCLGGSPEIKRIGISKALPEREVQVDTKSGGHLWIGATGVLIRDLDRNLEGVIVVARDISRRKQIDLVKSEVISSVAHELRSPLTSVKGFTSTLLNRWDQFDDEMKKHLLLTINTDADRVTRLIGELLDISRIESGRLELKKQMVDMKALAERSIERIAVQSETHAVKLGKWDPAIPETYADPDKIEQVLTNLLENAVKYSERGQVEVIGTLEQDNIVISVSDEGKGIPTKDHTRIFDKFARTSKASEHNPTGTGLGLFISKGLVAAHGGKIWVDEAPSGGARFAFSIPVSTPE